MLDDYTPTTEEVRGIFATADDDGIGPYSDSEARSEARFDRWLAAHDEDVRADEREKMLASGKYQYNPQWDYPTCGCITHVDEWRERQMGWARFRDRMIVCGECGNKRCPKATLCTNACTGSNEPGQAGSVYTKFVPLAEGETWDDRVNAMVAEIAAARGDEQA